MPQQYARQSWGSVYVSHTLWVPVVKATLAQWYYFLRSDSNVANNTFTAKCRSGMCLLRCLRLPTVVRFLLNDAPFFVPGIKERWFDVVPLVISIFNKA